MQMLSATDVAIRMARQQLTIKVERFIDRFGDERFAINDEHGVIEVHNTLAEADTRIAGVGFDAGWIGCA